MPISFECPTCGKKLKAPESAVGRASACPGCDAEVKCPEPIYEAEVVGAAHAPADWDPEPLSLKEERRPCLMCGEMIVATAVKCRFCDEVFDTALEKTSRSKPNRYQSDAASLDIEYIILAILCSGIALLVAVYWMIRGDPRGLNMVKVVLCVLGGAFLIGVSIGIILLLIERIGMR